MALMDCNFKTKRTGVNLTKAGLSLEILGTGGIADTIPGSEYEPGDKKHTQAAKQNPRHKRYKWTTHGTPP
jgi:hypothetical protein